jgi:2-polyprenyl-6-methoxyphenol hydroxylase-like FAD-dependent oxidoreductase
MSSEQTTVIVIGADPTGLFAAAELALAGVQVEVIDRLEQPDRIALRRTPACREIARQSIAKTYFMTRSFDQGPNRDHEVKGVLSA